MEWIYPTLVAISPALLAALITGVLTYCDLDTVFDAPPALTGAPRWQLSMWWWGFVLINAILAGILHYALNESGLLKDMNPWLKALVAGGSYSALVRLKFTTLPINGKDTPVGIETFYEGLKSLIHKRINRIIRTWRMEQSKRLAESGLADLRQQCKTMVISDALMSEEERKTAIAWIEQTVTAAGIEDDDRRLHLAIFIITGQRRSQSSLYQSALPAAPQQPPQPGAPSPQKPKQTS